ncbi:tol-pal system-associated acyl-CoA thioesterase [Rhodobacteraceae bacterium NNCM2]|nr:tol-pal system-associated acyl-CoA thioesterase [Coraliihabitans acroporae]
MERATSRTYRHVCRVYYEDTDLQGIVYYANYMRFIERGRTEAMNTLGIDQMALLHDHGVMFVVSRVEADYLTPARFGDDLEVLTFIDRVGAASVIMLQEIRREDALLFKARVRLAVVSDAGRPARLPSTLRELLVQGSGST